LRGHFEGTLSGKFTSGPLYNHSNGLASLQASLAGELTGTLPDGVTGATGSLDGAYILPCS
jgi:hypothetical protein